MLFLNRRKCSAVGEIFNNMMFVQKEYLEYVVHEKIDYKDTSNPLINEYMMLQMKCKDVLAKGWIWKKEFNHISDLMKDIVNKLDKCKLKRRVNSIAYLSSSSIIVQFKDGNYMEIDFAEYMEEFPDLKKLQKPEVFYKGKPILDTVRFGANMEVSVSAEFILRYGKKIERINGENLFFS